MYTNKQKYVKEWRKNMSQVYDVIIIGSGPAGMTAAIYAKRARLNVLVIEKGGVSGGQVLNTYEVDNYPGYSGISGYDLSLKFREHADKLEATFVEDEVISIDTTGSIKKVYGQEKEYLTKTIIIATGARYAKLNIPGENELAGMGVSYCATCDGAFFRNRTVAVVGGGDVAVEDAIFLARGCQKVYLIHRREELRAAKSLQEALFQTPNVETIWNHTVKEIRGGDQVESLILNDVNTKESSELVVDGVFIAVGIIPNSNEFSKNVSLNDKGYIIAGEECITSVPGIFVAGDVREKTLRQIVTGVADGANAVMSVQKYLIENR
ncbi:MAG: thioredoxin-disulfide reductase [Lachnospiraceae bacterium]|nr:thioredoxin-disulfide reductase [Lachnospiraceae bacterium]